MGEIKIALDAGHGKNTAGKRCMKKIDPNETREWVLNDRICRYMEELLLQYEDVKILRVDDRTGKKDIARMTRCEKANDWEADIYLSEHHNAGIGGGSGGGIVVYRYPNSSKFTKTMQKNLYNKLINHTGLKGNRSNPIPEKKFDVITFTTMPAVLIENGYMDSKVDVPIILSDKFARQSAQAQVEFLVEHFNLKKKYVEPPKEEKEETGEIYRVRKNWNEAVTQIGAFKVLQNAVNIAKKEVGYNVYNSKGKIVFSNTKKKPIIQIKQLYRVRKSWKDVASQLGAFTELENAVELVKKNTSYNVYDKSGKVVYSYPKQSAKPKTPSTPKINIKVDGRWGKETTRALQIVLGTIVDGILSNQHRNSITLSLTGGVDFGEGGSQVIRELQKLIGAKVDGYLGKETVTKLQKYLGTPVDGKISTPSLMVKELQRRLNKGKL